MGEISASVPEVRGFLKGQALAEVEFLVGFRLIFEIAWGDFTP